VNLRGIFLGLGLLGPDTLDETPSSRSQPFAPITGNKHEPAGFTVASDWSIGQ
jgi:hypothetical protein